MIATPAEQHSKTSPTVVQTAVVFLVLALSIATGGVQEAVSVRRIISEQPWVALGELSSLKTGTSRPERGTGRHAECMCISDTDGVIFSFPPDRLDDLPTR